MRRKEKCQRSKKKKSQSEFIIFYVSLIAATANNERGYNLLANNCDKNKELDCHIILILQATWNSGGSKTLNSL